MSKKKTRAADIKRQLAEEEREPSPFAGIVLKEKVEEKPAKKKAAAPVKAKKPGEIVQGYDPNASFADILLSFETTGNPYTLQKSKAKAGMNKPTDFGEILDQWEGKVRAKKMPQASPEHKSPAYKPTKSFADILNAYEGKAPEEGEKKPAVRKASQPAKPSAPYKPSKSFAEILDGFENPGTKKKPAVKEQEKTAAKPEEPVLSETLFKTPEEGEEKASGASWSIFGGKNEDFVRPEKPVRQPAKSAPEPAEPRKTEQAQYTETLFKVPEDDEQRAAGAAWSVFGDNGSFARPEAKAEIEPEKAVERVSPVYKPTKSFEDILSDYASKKAQRKLPEVKKAPALQGEGTVTLFKQPEEGSERAAGVTWSIYGGNSKVERKPVEQAEPEEPVKAEEPVQAYEPTRDFSEILTEFDQAVPRTEKVKTFEELMKEKLEAEQPKARLTIGKLRSMPPQSTLDLHGMTSAEAEKAVVDFLAECRAHGLRKISIITGKGLHSEDGIGVLKGAAERVLDNSGLVREKAPAPMNAGGSGALWIILKDEEQA